MEEAGGWGAGKLKQLVHVGLLVGCTAEFQNEECDAFTLGISDSTEDVRIIRVEGKICDQHSHFDAVWPGFLSVHLCHVVDGVGGEGAAADVTDAIDVVPEVLCAPPLIERLLFDHVAAELQQSHPRTQIAAGLQLQTLESAR